MSPVKMSKIEGAMRAVLAYKDAFNRHDAAAMVRLVSDDCVYEHHFPSPHGTLVTSREQIDQFWRQFFDQFSEVHLKIEEIYGFGDRCVMRWQRSGILDTGEGEPFRGADIFRLKDGSIREIYSYIKG